MIKHFSLLIIFSLGLLMLMPYAHHGIIQLMDLHSYISFQLQTLFSTGRTGVLARELITMLCIPLIISTIIAGFCFLAKKPWSPIFLRVLWASWLVQSGILVIIHKVM